MSRSGSPHAQTSPATSEPMIGTTARTMNAGRKHTARGATRFDTDRPRPVLQLRPAHQPHLLCAGGQRRRQRRPGLHRPEQDPAHRRQQRVIEQLRECLLVGGPEVVPCGRASQEITHRTRERIGHTAHRRPQRSTCGHAGRYTFHSFRGDPDHLLVPWRLTPRQPSEQPARAHRHRHPARQTPRASQEQAAVPTPASRDAARGPLTVGRWPCTASTRPRLAVNSSQTPKHSNTHAHRCASIRTPDDASRRVPRPPTALPSTRHAQPQWVPNRNPTGSAPIRQTHPPARSAGAERAPRTVAPRPPASCAPNLPAHLLGLFGSCHQPVQGTGQGRTGTLADLPQSRQRQHHGLLFAVCP
jgi:hypothetical protein